ncbi:DNA alkylation repair protein [Paludisphaera mucosa]|uniref:DNA alkylation repair protein n=1 Tax=Paludisphaera mucosa TaxID=3030827 RepID=A0ABT6FG03_9BACT|nr:DNA alkylation repair protein [Paludisphaera mucosa]MDG3006416.1 DNA alkylation repair protein [Paludisphaera mucosa]
MTAQEVLDELKTLGKPSIKKVLINHGACEPFFGVSVEDIKKIQKRIKKDHALALELYETGISDAMYLAGLIVDDARMTKADLNRWVKAASWSMLSESTVPWVASEGPHGWAMGLEWIESKTETIAAAGWSTLGAVLKIKPDHELELAKIGELLDRVAGTIHDQPNRVRLQMNGFVIDAGSFVAALTDRSLEVSDRIGLVKVNMGETACKVPGARESIEKIRAAGKLGKKRKTVKC